MKRYSSSSAVGFSGVSFGSLFTRHYAVTLLLFFLGVTGVMGLIFYSAVWFEVSEPLLPSEGVTKMLVVGVAMTFMFWVAHLYYIMLAKYRADVVGFEENKMEYAVQIRHRAWRILVYVCLVTFVALLLSGFDQSSFMS